MKIQATIELNDTQLLAVGLAETGELRPAKQSEVRDYMVNTVMASINTATTVTDELRAKAAAQVREVLGLPEVVAFGLGGEDE